MKDMDFILTMVFGTLTLLALLFGLMSLYFALRNARKKDGELAMAFWAVGALAGLSFAGMALAYFLIPIALNHLSR